MLALGLTGGMGMGKSTVAKMFVQRGTPHWDADAAVAAMYGWNDYHDDPRHMVEVVQKFRPDLIIPDGSTKAVDRQGLRDAVIEDPTLLGHLEAAAGPLLVESATRYIMQWKEIELKEGKVGVEKASPILFDAPLWFENFRKETEIQNRTLLPSGEIVVTPTLFDVVASIIPNTLTVVVTCPPEVQRERCFLRPGMTEEKFKLLTERQLHDADRRALADYVIDTSETMEAVEANVDCILVELKMRFC